MICGRRVDEQGVYMVFCSLDQYVYGGNCVDPTTDSRWPVAPDAIEHLLSTDLFTNGMCSTTDYSRDSMAAASDLPVSTGSSATEARSAITRAGSESLLVVVMLSSLILSGNQVVRIGR